MKKILTTLVAIIFLLPLSAGAVTSVPLIATTTTSTMVFPAAINGVYPGLMAPFFYATSTIGTTTIAGCLRVDSPTLVVDCTNHRVGIGTTSPQNKLSVYGGTGSNSYITVDADAAAQSGLDFRKANATKWFEYVPASSNDLRFNDGSDRVTLQSGGNVGIGTTSPASKFTVAGDALVTGNIFGTADQTFGYKISPISTGGMTFGTYFGTEWMRITQGGNVGIGTTSPTRQLVVQKATTGTVASFNAPGTPVIAVMRDDSTTGSGAFSWFNNAGTTVLQLAYNNLVGQGLEVNLAGSNIGFWNATGLGIGTTSPSVALEVNSNSSAGAIRISNSAVAGNYKTSMVVAGSNEFAITGDRTGDFDILSLNNTGKINFSANNGTTNHLAILSTGNVGIGSTTPWGLLSATNVGTGPSFVVEDSTSPDLSPFIIDTNGNVGIGTTTPASILYVQGTTPVLTIQQNSQANCMTLAFNTPTGLDADISQDCQASNIMRIRNTNGAITFSANNSPVEHVRIASGGNVGIGTTTPAYKLDVYNSASTIAGIFQGSGPSAVGIGSVTLASGSGAGFLQSYTNDSATATSNLALQPSAGNVGVGTTTPSQKLVVTGDILLDSTSGASNLNYRFNSAGVFKGLIGYNATTGNIEHYTSFSGVNPVMSLTASGNVGIGTTSPTTNLQVSASAATSTISVMSIGTTKGGRIILQDTSGGTCTEITAQGGALTAKAVTCP